MARDGPITKYFFRLIYDLNVNFHFIAICSHLGNEQTEFILSPFTMHAFGVVLISSCCILSFPLGHGGSDGAHGYVSSLDHAVGDLVLSLFLNS